MTWHVWSEILQGQEGPRAVVYPTPLPKRPLPTRPPAGGIIDKSGDGKWAVVYRPATEQEQAAGADRLVPIATYVKL